MVPRNPHRSRARRARLLAALLLGGAALVLAASRGQAGRRHVGLLGGGAAALGMTGAPAERRRPNHLVHEKSPYLLQHAYNPVDWYPWGDSAFEKARREGKPIFLSIGYSTCHWCHVMERESFEDDSVAAALNQDFVAIKVDREERPDVDRLYMTAMHALGMGGGWPLNVFLTPDLEPFFGGTYFPPRSIPGRIGMIELLPRIHEAWHEQREAIAGQGASVLRTLDSLATRGSDSAAVSLAERDRLIDRCADALAHGYDAARGGFGSAPKFPQVVNLNLLLRHYARDPAGRRASLDMVRRQLDAMQAGGIHDQLGGGFHRYSTDRDWLVPHFEKMLYDQAQLAWAYLDAYQLAGEPAYAATARGIFTYVARDLTSPDGAFYSAEDADSEGEEGRFYVWTPAQLAAVLPPDQAALVAYHYGVTEHGNFEHGTSILHEAYSVEETARHAGLSVEQASAVLEPARLRLLEARATRVRPHRDDKILAAWNGLMISAFARGARVLDDPALLASAERAAAFAWTHLRDPKSGALARRYRDGEVAAPGQLDDYAYLALGYLDLYRAGLDPVWLGRAIELTEAEIARFWDAEHGGFFESPAEDPHLPVRLKDDYDGAEISGNSIAAANLVTLGALLDRADWRQRAERTLSLFAARLEANPIAMPQMLVAMESAARPPRHIVIAGRRDAAEVRALRREFDRRFMPDDLLLLKDDGEVGRTLARLVPFTARLEPRQGRATAYVCVNYACSLPTSDVNAFAAQLDGLAAPPPPVGERR